MSHRTFGLAVLLLVTVTALVGAVVAGRLLGRPDAGRLPAPDPSAGLRVQMAVAQLLLRQGALSQRTDPLVLTGSEINAFLAHHVESRAVPLQPVLVRIEDGWLEVAGRASLGRVLDRQAPGWVAAVLPSALLELDVWLSAQGRLRVHDGTGEFVVDRAAIGRQAVSPAWLWRFLGREPSELLTWRVPRIVERIELTPGRVVIYTRPGSAGES